jgi:hypothetical protein
MRIDIGISRKDSSVSRLNRSSISAEEPSLELGETAREPNQAE